MLFSVGGLFFETGSCYVTRLASDLWSSCINFLSAGITGVCQHAQPILSPWPPCASRHPQFHTWKTILSWSFHISVSNLILCTTTLHPLIGRQLLKCKSSFAWNLSRVPSGIKPRGSLYHPQERTHHTLWYSSWLLDGFILAILSLGHLTSWT
jgi:hypothetical protein